MTEYPRSELDEMVTRWLDANEESEKNGDWKNLAEFYTEDATYGWNLGPKEDVMAVGRDEIRDIALGIEMEGLEGWSYPYQKTLVDNVAGEVVGFWKQRSEKTRADGSNYEIYGIGGSWFRYGGNFQWSWQRDFFDFGHVSSLYLEMMTDKAMSPAMNKRIEKAMSGVKQPGYYPIGQAPVPIRRETSVPRMHALRPGHVTSLGGIGDRQFAFLDRGGNTFTKFRARVDARRVDTGRDPGTDFRARVARGRGPLNACVQTAVLACEHLGAARAALHRNQTAREVATAILGGGRLRAHSVVASAACRRAMLLWTSLSQFSTARVVSTSNSNRWTMSSVISASST